MEANISIRVKVNGSQFLDEIIVLWLAPPSQTAYVTDPRSDSRDP